MRPTRRPGRHRAREAPGERARRAARRHRSAPRPRPGDGLRRRRAGREQSWRPARGDTPDAVSFHSPGAVRAPRAQERQHQERLSAGRPPPRAGARSARPAGRRPRRRTGRSRTRATGEIAFELLETQREIEFRRRFRHGHRSRPDHGPPAPGDCLQQNITWNRVVGRGSSPGQAPRPTFDGTSGARRPPGRLPHQPISSRNVGLPRDRRAAPEC